MRLLHELAKTHARFDDPHLVSQAGLVPVMALAQRAGLADLAGEHVRISPPCGVNPQVKVPCLVAGTLIVRMDSAFYGSPACSAARQAGARFSVTVRTDPKVRAAIAAWRYHAVFTDSPFTLLQAEEQYRGMLGHGLGEPRAEERRRHERRLVLHRPAVTGIELGGRRMGGVLAPGCRDPPGEPGWSQDADRWPRAGSSRRSPMAGWAAPPPSQVTMSTPPWLRLFR